MFIARYQSPTRCSVPNEAGELDVFDDFFLYHRPPREMLGADMSVHLGAAGTDMITRACITELGRSFDFLCV